MAASDTENGQAIEARRMCGFPALFFGVMCCLIKGGIVIRSRLIALAALTVFYPSGAQVAASPALDDLAVYARAQRLVALPDGRHINLYCTGKGAPTVILEGGWTTTTMWWRTIQARVATTSHVCSYDRAGYGFSDAAALPRSAAALHR